MLESFFNQVAGLQTSNFIKKFEEHLRETAFQNCIFVNKSFHVTDSQYYFHMYTLAIDKRSYDTGYACNDLLAIHTCNTLKYGTRVFVSKFNLYVIILYFSLSLQQ